MAEISKAEIQEATRRLAECIEKDPTGQRGEPVFRGTRVPVKSFFDHLAAGDSVETFRCDFPEVTKEQVRAVVEAARLQLLKERKDAKNFGFEGGAGFA